MHIYTLLSSHINIYLQHLSIIARQMMMIMHNYYPLIFSSVPFIVLIIHYFRRNYAAKQQKLNLPPGPMKLPFIGNLHQLAGLRLPRNFRVTEVARLMLHGPLAQLLRKSVGMQLPHRRMTELARQYGPLMHLKLGEIPVVVVSDAETAEEMLKTQDVNIAQRPQLVAFEVLRYDYSGPAFAHYGEYWRQMRKVVVHELLSAKRVRSFRSIRENEMKNVIEQITSAACDSSIVNLTRKMDTFINYTLYKSALGEEINPNHLEQLTQLERESVELSGGFHVSEVYPSVGMFRHLLGVKTKMHLLCDRINNLMDDILTTHKNKRDNKNLEKSDSPTTDDDIIDAFLRIQESNETGVHVTTNNIKGVIRDVFGAGVETPSTTLEWAMSELLKNPTIMNKAQTEVREVVHLKGKKQIDESDVEELKYLKLVIKETLRLHPPVPMYPREAIHNCKVNGYDVPVKTTIMINFWAIGRDPKYWTNPEKFDPERFLDSPVNFNGSYFQFVPFGSGKRMCPGITFANAGMELLLAALLYHFDWKLPNGHNPQELDMDESFTKIVKRQNDLCVIATKVL